MNADPSRRASAPQPTGEDLRAFVRHKLEAGDRLYAVIDAARDRELADAVRSKPGMEVRWLFNGPTPTTQPARPHRRRTVEEQFQENTQSRMSEVAPYVVDVPVAGRGTPESAEFLEMFAERLGTSVGILLLTPAMLDDLARHLRSLFHATDEDLKKFYFRFYDPRVLRPYLPTCTPAETREFFGPVKRVFVESPTPGRINDYRPGPEGVDLTEESLISGDLGTKT